MDSAIPVEVARFRTKEGLVYREVCGATRGRLRRAPAPLLYRSPVRSPEGTLSLRAPNRECCGALWWRLGQQKLSVLVLPGESFAERLTASAKR